jgi:hypothetical protein
LVDEAGQIERFGADPAHRACPDGSAWVLGASIAEMIGGRNPHGTGLHGT